jgi:hypothetical protein
LSTTIADPCLRVCALSFACRSIANPDHEIFFLLFLLVLILTLSHIDFFPLVTQTLSSTIFSPLSCLPFRSSVLPYSTASNRNCFFFFFFFTCRCWSVPQLKIYLCDFYMIWGFKNKIWSKIWERFLDSNHHPYEGRSCTLTRVHPMRVGCVPPWGLVVPSWRGYVHTLMGVRPYSYEDWSYPNLSKSLWRGAK